VVAGAAVYLLALRISGVDLKHLWQHARSDVGA
jgi:hypothetical protein